MAKKRGRKPGKMLGPLRFILGTEPFHFWLPHSKTWATAGTVHVLECGHRLLVEPDRDRKNGYRDRRSCPKCRDGLPAPPLIFPLGPLRHITPLRRFRS